MKRKTMAGSLLAIVFLLSGARGEEIFRPNDRVMLLGGTLAERLQYHGWLESQIQQARPGLQLVFRNLGWSGDEVSLMPRPLKFESLEETLAQQRATVALLFFGSNESFRGESGTANFRENLKAYVARLRAAGVSRLVLFSSPAVEPLPDPFPDVTERNRQLARYGEIVSAVADEENVPFVDLHEPTRSLMAENQDVRFTINGVHFNVEGNCYLSQIIANGLGVTTSREVSEPVRALVVEKNRQFFFRWRPSNAEYIFGRRKEPYGVISFPPEMAQLDEMVAGLDADIHRVAATSEP